MEKRLSLVEIEDLGGTKEDLSLLKGVDEGSSSEMEFEDLPSSKDAELQEINTFMKSIGLASVAKGKGGAKKPGTLDRGVFGGEKKPGTLDRGGAGWERKPGRHSTKLEKLDAKPQKKLLVPLDSGEPWFKQSDSEVSGVTVCPATLHHLARVGEKIMEVEVQLYQKARQKSKGTRDVLWLKTVLSAGTLGDKVAALTLLVQESPVHTLSSLDSLLTMASKKGKRESILAADALKELWISELLPDERKLKSLKQRPFHLLTEEPSEQVIYRKLVLWLFEDKLKAKFAMFLSTVKLLSHDSVPKIREKMIGYLFDLLYRKPEQEQQLLSQLVNKLGDPVKRVASKAVLFLLKLVRHHTNMKPVVVKELECFLHRPNVSPRAQYYTICALNQFVITPGNQELPQKLVEIYFTFFKMYASKKELDAKMLAALLTGVNRAFPYVEGDIPSFEEHLQALFKVVHVGPLATAIQSLVLLYQVMESRQAVSGRYYQALYTKLLDPRLRHCKKQAIFLNLLFKSLKSDPETKRVKAFLKRVLQVCAFHSPPFVCGCLFLISEVLKQRPGMWTFVVQSETTDEEHFVDVDEDKSSSCTGVARGEGCGYQIAGRNPLFCKAETSCLWELARLQSHYHPSVQAFAKKLTQSDYIQYRGDPLQDFTLMRFLDRFVSKNPKQKVNDHGGSLMQRTSRLLNSHQKEITINSARFAALSESKVREDELFMHKYFVSCQKSKKESLEENASGNDGDFSDSVGNGMDFAGELEKQKKVVSHKKKEQEEEETDSDLQSAEEDEISEQELSENDFDNFDEEGSSGTDWQKLLIDNMSSSEEEDTYKKPRKKKRKGPKEEQADPSSMFATAEEFAHLLENTSKNSYAK